MLARNMSDKKNTKKYCNKIKKVCYLYGGCLQRGKHKSI